MKRIVVASDSFKGCLTSCQVAEAVECGVHEVFPDCEVIKLNVADGGEGTMLALSDSVGGERVAVQVHDPLGRPMTAHYLMLRDGVTAVMDMSSASGLTLLRPEERNPMRTSTYGTGELIKDALSKGCRRFLVGIGGSATNDAGMGMLSALGFRFLDKGGTLLGGVGESLSEVHFIDMSEVPEAILESEFTVACDVDSPFCGPDGAAYVFAPQKGADRHMVEELDKGMSHFAELMKAVTGKDVCRVSGAGAAGGLGGAFSVFLNARLERGVDMVLDAYDFDRLIEGADLVITGEGRIDSQTLTGKTPYGVMKRALRQGIPVVAIGGSVADLPALGGFDAIYQVTPENMDLPYALEPEIASQNICRTVVSFLRNPIF